MFRYESRSLIHNAVNNGNYYQQNVAYGKFEGFVSHYHVSKRKIDCAGLDIKTLLDEVKEE